MSQLNVVTNLHLYWLNSLRSSNWLVVNWQTMHLANWLCDRSPWWLEAGYMTRRSSCCVNPCCDAINCLADGHWRQQLIEDWTKPEKGTAAITSPLWQQRKRVLYFTKELLNFMTTYLLNYNKLLLSVLFHFSLSICHFLSLYHCASLLFEKIVSKDVIQNVLLCVCVNVCIPECFLPHEIGTFS